MLAKVDMRLKERLSASAYAHSVRTADTAEKIARQYDVDPDAARLAAMLHDWDRELGDERLIEAALAAGLEVTAEDRRVPYLLHARTAAAHVSEQFPGLEPQVVAAVARHTVGAEEMTPLDMVVFLADMLEPSRDWEGIAELRAMVGSEPLERLFAKAYQRSVAHLVAGSRVIHSQTVMVWNAHVAGVLR